MDKRALEVAALQEMIDKPYCDIWLTVTFRAKKLTESAVRAFKFFFKRRLNTPQQVFFEKFIECWVFFEKGDIREGIHIHALIKGIDPSLASLLQKECEQFFGQSKVVAYDHSRPKDRQASAYLARKYHSRKLDHFDFFKINSSYRQKVMQIIQVK